MKSERQKEIKKEAESRLAKLLESKTIDEVTVNRSFIRFDMALNLIGLLSDEEFYSDEYDSIVRTLFNRFYANQYLN